MNVDHPFGNILKKFNKHKDHYSTFEKECLYRGSYMSDHVLLNLLNELGKRDKMRGAFNKINNTRANLISDCCHYLRNVVMDVLACSSLCNSHHSTELLKPDFSQFPAEGTGLHVLTAKI